MNSKIRIFILLIIGCIASFPLFAKRARPAKNVFTADIAYGMIGAPDAAHPDDAYDNVFHIRLPRMPLAGEVVSLQYELKGVSSHSAVSRSINDGQAVGGYFVRMNRNWSAQTEYLATVGLKPGDNVVRFGLPAGAAYHYEVRNLRMVITKRVVGETVLLNTYDERYYGNQGYLSGIADPGARLYCNGQPVPVIKGEFEIWIRSERPGPFSATLKAVSSTGRATIREFDFRIAEKADLAFRPLAKGKTNTGVYHYNTGLALKLNIGQRVASVTLSPGALPTVAAISLTALHEPDITPVGTEMVNVTAGAAGFRFLPHGSRFRVPAHLRIPCDTAKLPAGFSMADVRVFFFEENSRKWVMLPADTGKMQRGMAGALSMHFTDMIAGIIKVPESPQTQGYTPTSIKDFKAADPSSMIDMIAPPAANAMGTASLSYPIRLPKGRAGMQPDLRLQYSNEGVNGWMGLGWSLNVPAITIDTRWGVPRYNSGLETETYMLSGAQLAPLANRNAFVPRVSEREFHVRVEGGFEKIVRHGNAPSNYWWEVTNKNGVISSYGGTKASGPVAAAVLKDDNGNIAYWGLVETRDLRDNYVAYNYKTSLNLGLANGTVPGRQLYLNEIRYTGSGSTPGRYRVQFQSDSLLRQDVEISGRLGFKMVSGNLLKKISVNYMGNPVRAYYLRYQQGEFYKQLLTSVELHDNVDALVYSHTFDYYDDVKNAAYLGLSEDWSPAGDGIKGDLINPIPGFTDENSTLSTVKSSSAGGGLALTIGIGYSDDKSLTVGGGVGFDGGSNEGLVTMVDINGDGLPDKIIKKNGALYFRPNLGSASAQKFGSLRPINGIGNFSSGSSRTNKANVQAVPFGGFVGYEKSTTTSTTHEYFADFNGDGLIDLASYGQVWFNHLDAQGNPNFTTTSTPTPNPITPGAAIDPNFLVADMTLQQTQETDFPLQDAVRSWTAPFDGTIAITGTVQLMAGTGSGLTDPKQDGIRVSIQHNDTHGGVTVPWDITIPAGDLTARTPTQVNNIPVNKGDRFYFRLQSNYNGNGDLVNWDPVIDYQPPLVPPSDANGRLSTHYKASEDFILDNHHGTLMIKDGDIMIDGSFIKGLTSDQVEVTAVMSHLSGTPSILFDYFFTDAQTPASLPSLSKHVSYGDTLRFYIKTDSYIDRAAIHWVPHYVYTHFDDLTPDKSTNGTPLVEAYIAPDNTNYNEWSKKSAPLSATASDQITITADIAGSAAATGTVIFTVKGTNKLYAKQVLQLNGGMLTSPAGTTPLTLQAGKDYFFDYAISDRNLALAINKSQVVVNTDHIDNSSGAPVHQLSTQRLEGNLYTNPASVFLGAFFRGWGQFSYKGTKGGTAQIDESQLNMNQYQAAPNDPAAYPDEASLQTLQNPTELQFIVMTADARRNIWLGNDTSVFVSAKQSSSSRLFLHDVSVDPLMQGAALSAAEKVNVTNNKSVTLGYGVNNSSSTSNSVTKLDMMDMNGDRYPDVLNENSVQYTQADGELEPSAKAPHGLGGASGSGSSKGLTYGGEFLKSSGDNKTAGNAIVIEGNAEASLGANGSIGSSKQDGNTAWIDVNGDGLPDKVSAGGMVSLNLGYGFALPENWNIGMIDKNTGQSVQGGIGLSLFGGSWEFGFGLNRSTSTGSYTLSDVNGDGLVDQVYDDGVQLNTGNGFASKVNWSALSNFNDNVSTGESINAAYSISFNPGLIIPIKIVINPSVNAGHSVSRERDQIMDIDGDGFPDILHSDNDGDLHVRRSLIGRTNMLKTVNRPMGGYFMVDYERKGNNYKLPQNKWVMKSLEVFDGVPGDGIDTERNNFVYYGGSYDRKEREFYGFDTVMTRQLNTASNNALYRTNAQQFVNGTYYTKGLVQSEWLEDAAGNKFTQTNNQYDLRQVQTDVAFPALTRVSKLYYEGQKNVGASATVTYDYDSLGNMIFIHDFGDNSTQDETLATVVYHDDPVKYIKAVPLSISVTNAAGAVMRSRSTVMDNYGEITQISQALPGSAPAVYDVAYDSLGNLSRITRPANVNNERLSYTYTYDPDVHTYVNQIQDAYGYTSSSNYDPVFGNILKSKSLNGDSTIYGYDNMGRLTTVKGPLDSGKTTISFEYYPYNNRVSYAITHHYDPQNKDSINTVTFMDGLGRAIQVKKPVSLFSGKGAGDLLKFVVSGRVNYDAFGRAVKNYYPVTENKVGANGVFNNSVGNITSTNTFDVEDRPLTQVLADGSQSKVAYTTASGFLVRTNTDALNHVRQTIVDVRERKRQDIAQSGPAGFITTTFDYNNLSELVKVTDNSGNKTLYTYDNLGRKLSAQYPDAGLTSYVYDLAGNMTQKITAQMTHDIPKGGAINYQYDHERLIGIDYPMQYQNKVTYRYGTPQMKEDAGRIILQEDASGGLESHYNALGQVIKQVRTVMVNTVFYTTYVSEQTYDTWNRITSMTYPDGEKLIYRYNRSGNLDSLFGDKEGHHYSYVRQLGYDEYDQRVYLQYGNGTETNYSYDVQRRRLTTLKATSAGGRAMMDNTYTYDPVSNILSIANAATVVPGKFGGASRQDYVYDGLYRLVSAKGSYTGPRGPANYALAMDYDNLYNVTSKKQTSTNSAVAYNLNYAYVGTAHQATTIGNDQYTYNLNGDQKTYAKRENFWDEENRLISVTDDGKQSLYTYDATGERVVKSNGLLQGTWINNAPAGNIDHNLDYTAYVSPYLVCKRTSFTKHIYIESQRIATKIGNGNFIDIAFPSSSLTAGGINYLARAKQLQSDRIAYYASKGYSPGPPTNKLYYALPQNSGIAPPVLVDSTVAVPSGWPSGAPASPIGPTITNPTPSNDAVHAGYGFIDTLKKSEDSRFFYHSDHLGSTAYVTNISGEISQHEEYTPFGESYAEEQNITEYASPYLFNAKERDPETGLYYYGARYYNPKTSAWISTDPMVDKYPGLSPYNYALNNPVKLIDPTGKSVTCSENLKDGICMITGGQLDNDKGIYNQNGERIGQSLTDYSFFSDKKQPVVGASINLNGEEGTNFLNKEVFNTDNSFLGTASYFINARNGKVNDFKSRKEPKNACISTSDRAAIHYEGSLYDESTHTYASARDFGNIAAGYKAGDYGLPWYKAAAGFDTYQNLGHPLQWQPEGPTTRSAEKIGFDLGHSAYMNSSLLNRINYYVNYY